MIHSCRLFLVVEDEAIKHQLITWYDTPSRTRFSKLPSLIDIGVALVQVQECFPIRINGLGFGFCPEMLRPKNENRSNSNSAIFSTSYSSRLSLFTTTTIIIKSMSCSMLPSFKYRPCFSNCPINLAAYFLSSGEVTLCSLLTGQFKI